MIDEPGTVQYGRLLAVVDTSARAAFREYNLAPDFDGPGAARRRLRDLRRAQLLGQGQDLPGLGRRRGLRHLDQARRDRPRRPRPLVPDPPRWSPDQADARHHHRRARAPTCATTASTSRRATSTSTSSRPTCHESRNTTGDTVWKGASTGSSRASYEGLIEIIEKATNSHTYLQTHSLLLSRDAKVDAIPSLIVKVDDVSASHGGTVGEVDEDQVFYMRTRGIDRETAIRILVEGFFEPVITLFEDEHLEELVRERIAGKLAEASEDIAAYAASDAERRWRTGRPARCAPTSRSSSRRSAASGWSTSTAPRPARSRAR